MKRLQALWLRLIRSPGKIWRSIYQWCVKLKNKIRVGRDKRREIRYGNFLIWCYRDELCRRLLKSLDYRLSWSTKEVSGEIKRLSKIVIYDYINKDLC